MPKYEEKIFNIIDNYIKEKQKANQDDLYRELVLHEKAPLKRLLNRDPIEYCLVIHRPNKSDNTKEQTLLGLLFENNLNKVIDKLLDNEFSEEFINIKTIQNSREIIPYDQLIKGLDYENSSESLIKLAKRNNDLLTTINNLKNNLQATTKSEVEKIKLALQPEIQLIKADKKNALQVAEQLREKEKQDKIENEMHAAEQRRIETQLQAECEQEEAQLRALNLKYNLAVPPEMLGYKPVEKKPVDVSKSIIHDSHSSIASGGVRSTLFSSSKPSLTPNLDQWIADINKRPRNHHDLEPELDFEDEGANLSQHFPCKKV